MKKRQSDWHAPAEPAATEMDAVEVKPVEAKVGFDVETKIQTILASAMPEAQKAAYIASLRPAAVSPALTFAAYANMKKIKPSVREVMKSYPAAKGVVRASFEAWDEIFKNF